MKEAILIISVLSTVLVSCSDDDSGNLEPGDVTVNIQNLVGGVPLELNTQQYPVATGGVYQIEDFRFYITNIKFNNTETSESFGEDDSYHLMLAFDQSSQSIQIPDVPAGIYDEIEFSIGVDPVKNLSTDNVGDLDPNNKMAWNWDTGYKFVLLEGRFFPESGSQEALVFHIGFNRNYRTFKTPLGVAGLEKIDLVSKGSSQVMLQVEISQMFQDPNDIDFNSGDVLFKFQDDTDLVAENYSTGMFTITDVQ